MVVIWPGQRSARATRLPCRLCVQVVALRSRDPFGAVLEALRGQIRSGQLPPGEPLIVMDLARALGISATAARTLMN